MNDTVNAWEFTAILLALPAGVALGWFIYWITNR